ncbi:unnamed protein product [Ectocarpus fasciculatus]
MMTTAAPATTAAKNLSAAAAAAAAAVPAASAISLNRSPNRSTLGEGETDGEENKVAARTEGLAAAAAPAGDPQAQTATPVMPAAANQDVPCNASNGEVGAAIGPLRENEGGVGEGGARESHEGVPAALGVGRKGGSGGGGGDEERGERWGKVAAAGASFSEPHGEMEAALGVQASTGAAAAGTAVASGAEASSPSVWDLDSLDFEEEEDQETEEANNDGDHEPEAVGRNRWTKAEESHNSSRQDRGRDATATLQANQEKSGAGDANGPAGADERPRKKRCAGVSSAGRPAGGVGVAAAAAAAAATVLTGPIPIRPVTDCGLLHAQQLESAIKKRESGVTGDGGGGGAGAAAAVEAAAAVVATAVPYDRARELMPPPPPNITRAKMRRRRSRVSLMHSVRYQRLCGLLERHSRRDDLLYAMLGACGLPERLSIVAPARATDVHLGAYHDKDYVEALRNAPSDVKILEEYGLVEDCEVFEELYEHCCAVAGASLHAADRLCRGEADVAINWGGGRHHAKKGEAAGFCYVNDCVLAVLHLLKTFDTVLTIDIDVHHGDGVQDAFYMSNKVMTMSFHHVSKGFFPGAGQCSETGAGNGRDYNLNIPLKEGCGDGSFLRVYTNALQAGAEGF